MMKLKRLADPQLSPDGAQVAYALTEIDLAGGDAQHRPVARAASRAASRGGSPRTPRRDTRPRFSPDGERSRFLSTRDGSSQVWALELAGGEPRKLTSLATGVDAFEWLGSRAGSRS